MHIATGMTLQRTMLSEKILSQKGLNACFHLHSILDSNGEQISDCQELRRGQGWEGNGRDYERATWGNGKVLYLNYVSVSILVQILPYYVDHPNITHGETWVKGTGELSVFFFTNACHYTIIITKILKRHI